jgi:hypothetical protein
MASRSGLTSVAAVVGLGALGAGLALTGCGGQPGPPAAVAGSSVTAAPATTRTVTKVATVSAAPTTPAAPSTAPAATEPAPTSAQAQPAGGPNVTDPWAVVSAYYGDIDSGAYAQAYALIGNGAVTGQSYQQFAGGFACTGGQAVSENWESGDQVNFDLTATDSCTGGTDYYTGTDTVENGTITAADIQQTG